MSLRSGLSWATAPVAAKARMKHNNLLSYCSKFKEFRSYFHIPCLYIFYTEFEFQAFTHYHEIDARASFDQAVVLRDDEYGFAPGDVNNMLQVTALVLAYKKHMARITGCICGHAPDNY